MTPPTSRTPIPEANVATDGFIRRLFRPLWTRMCAPDERAYFAGVALFAPLVTSLFPFSKLPLMFLFPLAVNVIKGGLPRVRSLCGAPALLWMLALLIALHGIGLRIGATDFSGSVVIDIIRVAIILAIFLVGFTANTPERMLNGFFAMAIPAAVIASVLGLIKLALLERGYVLGPLITLSTGSAYPSGSSLLGDYNMFGLSLCFGAIGLVVRLAAQERPRFGGWEGLVSLSLVIAAGALAGSRRFFVVVPLIPLLWLALRLYHAPTWRNATTALAQAVSVAAIATALSWAVLSPPPKQEYEILALPPIPYLDEVEEFVASLGRSSGGKGRSGGPADAQERLRRAFIPPGATHTAAKLATTVDRGSQYGLNSRIDRWKLGVELLAQSHWIGGIGFSYHNEYSCRFIDCEGIDYPHAPILSEWLISGPPGLVAVLMAYGLAMYAMLRRGWAGLRSGTAALAVAVLPYSLISGDTLLSIPQTVVAFLLLFAVPTAARHVAGKGA